MGRGLRFVCRYGLRGGWVKERERVKNRVAAWAPIHRERFCGRSIFSITHFTAITEKVWQRLTGRVTISVKPLWSYFSGMVNQPGITTFYQHVFVFDHTTSLVLSLLRSFAWGSFINAELTSLFSEWLSFDELVFLEHLALKWSGPFIVWRWVIKKKDVYLKSRFIYMCWHIVSLDFGFDL